MLRYGKQSDILLSMRVISGKYKGAALASPHGEVRPTADMAKGSIFSILTSRGLLQGAECLDVFCGSGALGIEALSRGADSCVFVDINTKNAETNLKKLKIDARLVCADYKRALRMLKNTSYDIIFCDPPYKSGFAEPALDLILKYGLLKEDGLIIIEHSSSKNLIISPDVSIIDHRVFGVAALEFIKRGNNEGDNSGNV